MYYYIFDVRKCKNRRQIEAIKDKLSFLGISGEFVIPDRIRPAYDLAEQGIMKGYSTIVAIGADDIIDEVAAVMLNKQQAFGIIPMQASENISSIIGIRDWESAAECLRFRKITDTRVGIINERQVFFSYCQLDLSAPAILTVEFEDFLLQTKAKELYVSNKIQGMIKKDPDKLDVIIRSVDVRGFGIWGKIREMVSPTAIKNDIDLTLVRSDGVRIFSSRQIPIYADGRISAKTPATFGVSQKTIRLITKKQSN